MSKKKAGMPSACSIAERPPNWIFRIANPLNYLGILL